MVDVEVLVELSQSGMSLRDISAYVEEKYDYTVTPQAIHKRLKNYGYTSSNSPGRDGYDWPDCDILLDMYATHNLEDMSILLKEIGIDATASGIAKYMKKHCPGYEDMTTRHLGKGGQKAKLPSPKIVRLLLSKMAAKDVARRYDCSLSAVYKKSRSK